jgi:hypothetical protein
MSSQLMVCPLVGTIFSFLLWRADDGGYMIALAVILGAQTERYTGNEDTEDQFPILGLHLALQNWVSRCESGMKTEDWLQI